MSSKHSKRLTRSGKSLIHTDEEDTKPYNIVLTPEEDGWGAITPELPGGGDTIAEALDMLEDAKQGWFLSSLAHGDRIPEPDDYTYTV